MRAAFCQNMADGEGERLTQSPQRPQRREKLPRANAENGKTNRTKGDKMLKGCGRDASRGVAERRSAEAVIWRAGSIGGQFQHASAGEQGLLGA